jgi:ABC-type uncharacterized transport system fused permease/ATPase subunit
LPGYSGKDLSSLPSARQPVPGDVLQWPAWAMLVAVIGLARGIIWLGAWINHWSETFCDAIAAFGGAAMPMLILMFATCIAVGNQLRKVLGFLWRAPIAGQLQRDWLSGHRRHLLNGFTAFSVPVTEAVGWLCSGQGGARP